MPWLRQHADLETLSQSRTIGADLCFDPTDPEIFRAQVTRVEPQWIINLAALTDVDACELDPNAAYRANTVVNRHISVYLEEHPTCWALGLSTDHVYDSATPSAEDRVVIRNVYAYSKVAGEFALGRQRATVLRTNFFGPSRCSKLSFSDWVSQQW